MAISVARRFAENLIRRRKRADLSQEDLGFGADLHRTEVSLLEKGARIPRIDTLVKLAGALDIAPSDLLEGITWEPGETRPGRFELRGFELADGERSPNRRPRG